MLRIGLVGLTASGKTTLFNALVGAHEQVGTYAGLSGATHVASVPLADERLESFAETFKAKNVVPVQMEFLDTPGLAVGAHESRQGNARLLGTLREVDALGLAVRQFASATVAHPLGNIDPARDVAEIEIELALADLSVAEKRVKKLTDLIKRGGADAKQQSIEFDVLTRCVDAFNDGKGADTLGLNADELKLISPFAFLTLRPRIVIINLDENALATENWRGGLENRRHLISIAAEWEMEVRELDPAERAAFLSEVGINEPALPRVVRTCFDALGLVTFYTGMDHKEVRAWEIPRGTDIVTAAGRIHTDIARGFIRAEVISFDAFREHGSVKDARAAGKVRLEGRDYLVADGDILDIRFAI